MYTTPIVTIFQWCVISTTTSRNRIVADMMSPPEEVKHLNGETLEEMLGTCRDYARCDKEDGRIIFAIFQQKRVDIPYGLGEG